MINLPSETFAWDVGHLVNLQRPSERIRAAAGLRTGRRHDLRHAFAGPAAAPGDSLLVIGALLGRPAAPRRHAATRIWPSTR